MSKGKQVEYDSRADTLKHIGRVGYYMQKLIHELLKREGLHDKTKLESPEKELFDLFTPKLKKLTYGSEEYKKCLEGLGEALKHHYENNSHHPEHYEDGINGMCLRS